MNIYLADAATQTVHYPAWVVIMLILLTLMALAIMIRVFMPERSREEKILRQRDKAADRISSAFNRAHETMERVGKQSKWSDW
jgi:hypothetical protein